MSPIFSRSSAFKEMLRGIRKERTSENESVETTCYEVVKKRVKHLDDDSVIAPSFCKFITEVGVPPLDYVKELAKYDKDFLTTHQKEFDQILWYFWNRTEENLYELEDVLNVLCSSFPAYEKEILNSCYSAFLTKVIRASYELELLLERMADWDEIEGSKYFADTVEKSISKLSQVLISYSPFYDIIWILENRFMINFQTIDDEIYSRICGIYCESTIGELICENALNELFKLRYGLSLFFVYSSMIMREYDEDDIFELSEYYDVHVHADIVCKMK